MPKPTKSSIRDALRVHCKRMRKLVDPRNCARSSKLARKAANAKWAKFYAERK